MKPGEDLDALIAEKVMGWTCDTSFRPARFFPPGETILANGAYSPPEYSTDIAAAWLVVEKISEKYRMDIKVDRGFTTVLIDEKDVYISEKTSPYAICLAALRAVST